MTDETAPAEGGERRKRGSLQFGGRLQARRAGEAEALILGLLCTLDMITTLWWVAFGHASEANGLLAWTFQVHPAAFVVAKCASWLPALLLAPILARRRRKLTVWLLRAIIVLYIAGYLIFARF
jgi:hypothetical protein